MAPIHTILLPTDFLEHSAHAFRLAASLATDYSAQLIAVHVAPHHVVLYGGTYTAPEFKEYQGLLSKLSELESPGVSVTHRLVDGDPATEIVRLAESDHADLIVMGTHGRRGLKRLLMGSVAEHVARRAPCPVLLVKVPFHHRRPVMLPASATNCEACV